MQYESVLIIRGQTRVGSTVGHAEGGQPSPDGGRDCRACLHRSQKCHEKPETTTSLSAQAALRTDSVADQQQTFIPHGSGGWQPKVRTGVRRGLLPGVIFPQCPNVVEGVRSPLASCRTLHKGTHPAQEAPPSRNQPLPKAPPNAVTLSGGRASTQ